MDEDEEKNEDKEKNEDENEVEEDGGWMTREEEAVGDPPTIQIKVYFVHFNSLTFLNHKMFFKGTVSLFSTDSQVKELKSPIYNVIF